MAAAEIVGQLRGTAAEREAAYARLLQLEAEHFNANGGGSGSAEAASAAVEIAVACALPLCEVLCKAISEVDVAEYHRAAQVLTALSGVDPARVGGECWKPGQVNIFTAWMAPDSALGVLLAKDPASLSAEDAVTVALVWAPSVVQASTSDSIDAIVRAAGIGTTEMNGMFMPAAFMFIVQTPSDERNLILCPLLVDLLKAPEKLPDFALSGVLFALQYGVIGRPAVATKLLEHDAVAVLMAVTRQASPTELVATAGFSRRPHGGMLPVMKNLIESAQAGGADLSAELLTGGLIDTIILALSAVEEVGAEDVNAMVVVYGALGILASLDGEALPQIEDKLRAIPSELRYANDNEIVCWQDFGYTSGTFATIVAGECLTLTVCCALMH
jgi:hypothetical protein